jgi:DNA repair photolyase
MNLYRGCTHNCVYCDGRSEGYYVEGNFGEDVKVKVNAIDILRKELFKDKNFKGKFKQGYIMLGGGVGDSYQPVEKKYKLTKNTLELIDNYSCPVHILTKSTLVKRDLEILKKINDKTKAIVSMSFSSVDNETSKIFEPGVPTPSERLEVLSKFKKEGISCGMFLLPVIPFVTDKPSFIEKSIKKASEIGLDFVIFGGMTLKKGRQKDYFMNVLEKNYPGLLVNYSNIYKDDKWGNATSEYYKSLNNTFSYISRKYRINKRIPPYLFKDFLSENDLISIILEHMDYLLKLKGKKSPYGYAAYSISQIKKPLSSMKYNLRKIRGVGPVTEQIIWEILDTGSCKYYEKLLKS